MINGSTIVERESAYLIPRLRDLAFSVDIRYTFTLFSSWCIIQHKFKKNSLYITCKKGWSRWFIFFLLWGLSAFGHIPEKKKTIIWIQSFPLILCSNSLKHVVILVINFFLLFFRWRGNYLKKLIKNVRYYFLFKMLYNVTW